MRAKPAVLNGAPRSEVNTNGDFGSCSRWSRRSARNSSPRMGWVLGVPCLDPADVQGGRVELDLIPAQVHQLGRPQAMPVGHQDHGGVAVAIAVVFGGLHQPLDLGLGQVFAGAQVGVGGPLGPDCSVYGGWGDQPEVPTWPWKIRLVRCKLFE